MKGIFTPNIVPLDRRGDINEAELRRYVDWLIDHGVHGLYPNGSTGEFTRFTAEERRRIIADHRRPGPRPRADPGRRGRGQRQRNDRRLRALPRARRRAVAIVSPFYYKLSARPRLRLLQGDRRQLADRRHALQHPDVRLADRRADGPAAGGVARASSASRTAPATSPHMMRMISAVRPIRPDFAFLTGWDAALMPMLLIGCDGGTNATSGIVPEITRKLYDLTHGRRIDEARDAAIPPARAVRRDALLGRFPRRLPRRRRAARLRLRPRPPAAQRNAVDRPRRASARLQCILADFGVVEPPSEGCASRTGNMSVDRVTQITEEVLATA